MSIPDPLRRPNHYFNDSLGDPESCTGDHNHPRDLEPLTEEHHPPTLEERAEEAANEAACYRCQVPILADSSAEGVVFGRFMVPLIRKKETFQLCGRCGIALREFLVPEILESPGYLAKREALLAEWR